jgi:hypothetical protein
MKKILMIFSLMVLVGGLSACEGASVDDLYNYYNENIRSEEDGENTVPSNANEIEDEVTEDDIWKDKDDDSNTIGTNDEKQNEGDDKIDEDNSSGEPDDPVIDDDTEDNVNDKKDTDAVDILVKNASFSVFQNGYLYGYQDINSGSVLRKVVEGIDIDGNHEGFWFYVPNERKNEFYTRVAYDEFIDGNARLVLHNLISDNQQEFVVDFIDYEFNNYAMENEYKEQLDGGWHFISWERAGIEIDGSGEYSLSLDFLSMKDMTSEEQIDVGFFDFHWFEGDEDIDKTVLNEQEFETEKFIFKPKEGLYDKEGKGIENGSIILNETDVIDIPNGTNKFMFFIDRLVEEGGFVLDNNRTSENESASIYVKDNGLWEKVSLNSESAAVVLDDDEEGVRAYYSNYTKILHLKSGWHTIDFGKLGFNNVTSIKIEGLMISMDTLENTINEPAENYPSIYYRFK